MPGLPPLTRYCADCGSKHLVLDCPMNPEVKARVLATLNIIKVWPSAGSPSSSKIDVVAPVHVVTRARARELEEENKGRSDETTPSESTKKPKESWKARRTRRAASRKKQNETIEQRNKTAITAKIHQNDNNGKNNKGDPRKDNP